MKFNWGTGIALAYGAFALTMVGLVIASRQYDPNLVANDYYNLDLNYQARLVQKQNTASLKELPAARFEAAQKTIVLQFPSGMVVTGGKAKFFRSSTLGDDFTQKIETTPDGVQEIPAAKLPSGRWHVELDWEAGGKPFFYETTLVVDNA